MTSPADVVSAVAPPVDDLSTLREVRWIPVTERLPDADVNVIGCQAGAPETGEVYRDEFGRWVAPAEGLRGTELEGHPLDALPCAPGSEPWCAC